MKPILSLLLVLPLFLARAADSPRRADPFGGLLAPPDLLVRHSAQLGLRSEQQTRLRDIYEANHPAFREKGGKVAEAQAALRAAMEKHPLDEADANGRFAALLEAERAVKEIEFRTLVATRNVLTAEQFTKMRELQKRSSSSSPSDREAAIKAKLDRLKGTIERMEKAGKPPREHEQAIRELERAVRAREIDHVESLVDDLLRALGEKSDGAAFDRDTEKSRGLHTALRDALRAKDRAAIDRVVAEAIASAGASLAEPELPVEPVRAPEGSEALTDANLRGAFASSLERIERAKFWEIGLDPTQLAQFPRNAGSAIIGALAARRAGCDDQDRLLAVAREAGDFLLWAQAQGGAGLFPFPARRNRETKGVWPIVERALSNAEKQGRLAEVVRNGWCIDDTGLGDDGGLQIENAVCAIAVLHLHEATGEDRYLRAARAAGDWAIGRACVPNWNYNSFSVWLLAELHRVTGDGRYLDAAKEKTLIGVLPGQLTEGPREGRWLDPHNARPNYHYIITRALACLLPRIAEADPAREPITNALRRALLAWNPVFTRDGAPNLSSASEALALLELRLPNHAELLGETGTRPALLVLERLMLLGGRTVPDPSSVGLLLEAAARRGQAKAAS